jgi:hypothetical protein
MRRIAFSFFAAKSDSGLLARLDRLIARADDWALRHQRAIRRAQTFMIGLYAALLFLPPFLSAPEPDARVWTSFTLFAQFMFWGVWQPFVLVSIVFAGRLWCGALCPEGALSEGVSQRSRGLATPRWLMWRGWPFVAFCAMISFGQMSGAYHDPKATLVLLGFPALGAIAAGLLYARNKRVWCRYLCPVSGLFAVTAKLAPFHFKVDRDVWLTSPKPTAAEARAANCAPLIPVRTMRGASECHMCGRCSGFRGAVVLARRSPNHEIVCVARDETRPWETWMIGFGMIGLVGGAFHWASSPFASAPGGVSSAGGGSVLLAYLAMTALLFGGGALFCVAAANQLLGPWSWPRFHHLAQCLIPVAACCVFLAFSTVTSAQLGVDSARWGVLQTARVALAAGAGAWSAFLGRQIIGRQIISQHARGRKGRLVAAQAALCGAVAIALASWAAAY